MPSGGSSERVSSAVEAARDGAREVLARIARLFGPRPALVPIPVRVTTPAQRRQEVLEALRDQHGRSQHI